MKATRALDSNVKLAYVTSHWAEKDLKVMEKLNCFSVHLNYRFLTDEIVQFLLKEGYQVLAYTVDDPVVAQQLFNQGVCAVFSNDAGLMVT